MTILAGTALLGVLIFFHELGHFLVAKACGVRVLTFSLGFGPRLIGFTIGDTDYRLSLLPLGGYVKMYGDDLGEDVPEHEKPRSFLHQPIWKKSAIAFAGPFANFLLPFVILFIGALGTEKVADTLVGTVMPGEAAARAGIAPGDRIVAVDGAPVALFGDLVARVGSKPEREVRLTVERSEAGTTASREVTLVPRAVGTGHPLERDVKVGRIGIMPHTALPVVDVIEGSPAHAAGLRTKDHVLTVDGEPVTNGTLLLATLRAAPQKDFTLTVKRGDSEDPVTVTLPAVVEAFTVVRAAEPMRFGVTRDESDPAVQGRVQATDAILDAAALALAESRGTGLVEGTIAVVDEGTAAHGLGLVAGARVLSVDGYPLTHADELSSRLDETPDGVHVIGVLAGGQLQTHVFRMTGRPERGLEEMKYFGARAISAFGGGSYVEREVGVAEGVTRAASGTWALIAETAKGLYALVTGQVSMKSLGGPITIFNLAGQALDSGVDRWLRLLLFISVNLGLLNLLPVPVLDGGHLMLFAIEGIQRKELSLKTKERALKVGFAMLLALMVIAIVNDVLRLIG
jgi:regulator of sigma E protease